MRSNALLHGVIALSLFFVPACTHDTNAENPRTQVRLFLTPDALNNSDHSVALRAIALWPVTEKYGMYEIADFASPLIDLEPGWGSYVGISQSEVERDGIISDREMHLVVKLNSYESIAFFSEYCSEQGYVDCIILVYRPGENIGIVTAKEIIEQYQESP